MSKGISRTPSILNYGPSLGSLIPKLKPQDLTQFQILLRDFLLEDLSEQTHAHNQWSPSAVAGGCLQ